MAELPDAIAELKRQRNAVILAHYYQDPAIQDIADFIGDSLELSRQAAATEADVIVFCGVHFMAETAKILNPGKTVLLPDLNAGCSLADACPADAFAAFRAAHPDHFVVSYINCSAAVKAQSDLICTSSNAVDLINQLPEGQPILFAPDQNLGRWVQRQSGRELSLWPGSCQVHFIGSTSSLLRHAGESPASAFIVLTEPGILHQMQRALPHKTFRAVPGQDGCSCNTCPYMRLNTLDKLWDCLHNLAPAINLDEELRLQALAPIERMLAMSR
ncbi:MAG: quinolinate synthase NadA [Cyanobacteria bacterium]|nr:quinolinate synthase NadA [Cyanobacteriota bacterium]